MSVDAGTIWASIRIRLDKLNADVGQAVKKMDGMAAAINNSGKSLENLNKLGSKLSLTVTAPIVAAGAAAVKFASDQNESLNAANVVFKTSAKTITAWGENAAKQAGLSKAEFYQSAAVTGAMLKGMNYSLDESADATIQLTKRAADMASIFNTDVKDSTTAVAAAIRGEMEPIRRYGVTLNDVMVKAKAMAMGLYSGKGELDSYAKAQARVALILEQTKDIAGDFVNTSDQQANSTRILIAETKNQAAALGQQLLPYALQLIQGLRKIVDGFGSMTDAQKKTIIQIAALAAGLGPVTLGIGKAIQAVKLLQVAMVALSTNPVFLALAGVIALTVALEGMAKERYDEQVESVGRAFADMGEVAGLTAKQITDVQGSLIQFSSNKGGGLAEAITQIEYMNSEFGATYDQIQFIASKSADITDEYKKTLTTALALKQQEEARYRAVYGSAAFAEKFSGATKETAEAMKEMKAPEISEQIRERINAEKEYQASLQTAIDLKRLSAIDDKEHRELQIKAAEDYRDALVEIGYASEKEVGTKGQAALVAIIATLKSLGAETGSFDSLIEKVNALDTETAKTSSTMRQSLLNELNVAKAGGMGGDLFDELERKVNAFYDELAKKEAMDQFKANLTFALDSANSMFGALSSLISATYDAKQERLELDMAQELEANGLAEESAVQKAEKQVTEAEAAGNAETAAEARKALKKAQIEEKYAKQKREIEYEGAMMVWDLQRAQAVTSGILAVMNAFASGSAFGPIVAAAYAATAGLIATIQVAAVDQSKPVKKYQTGGIVAPRGGGEVALLAENGYTETLFNSGPSGQAFVRQMGEAIANYLYANQGTGESFTFVLDINAETVAKAVVPIIRDGNVRYTI